MPIYDQKYLNFSFTTLIQGIKIIDITLSNSHWPHSWAKI